MKFTILLLGAALAVAVAADQPLEEYLTASLLKLKKEMPAGIPALNIPPTDPLPLPEISKEGSLELIEYSFLMKDAEATGLSTFDPRSVSVVDGQLEIRLAFPALEFAGDYELSGSILGFPISGAHGSADVTVMDVGAVFTAAINASDSGVASLIGSQLVLQAGSSLLMLQRFPSIDQIVKKALQLIADEIFAEYKPVLEAGLGDVLTKALNAALMVRGAMKSQAVSTLNLPEMKVYEAGNANEFLDHMISMARPSLAEKDPISLPDASKGFEKGVLGVTVHGEVKIYDGFLAGIQTIHRTGDAEMEQSPDMTKLKISAHMGVSNMHGHYRMHAKFMNIGPSAEVSLKVSMVSCELKVNVDMSSGKPKAELEHLDISYIGDIDLYFDGLGPLDWLINPLGGWIINLIKHKIADAVEGPLKQIISEKMKNVEVPIGY